MWGNKWDKKKHAGAWQLNSLCTGIFNTPLLLFKVCCCFYLAALLPSFKANLVQASPGSALYWITGESGSISTCLNVLLGQEELKRSSFALPYRVLIWFVPIRTSDTPSGWLSKVAASLTSWHSSAGVISQSGPVGFIANRSKTFIFRLRLVHFQSAAEYAIHHTPNRGLVASMPAPSPSPVSPWSLAGCIVYMQEDIADVLPKAVCNAKC